MRVTRENIAAIPDNCPDCLTPTPPAASTVTGDQLSSLYQCRNGHTWSTNRSVAAYVGFESINYPS